MTKGTGQGRPLVRVDWLYWTAWADADLTEGKTEHAEQMLRMVLRGTCWCSTCRDGATTSEELQR